MHNKLTSHTGRLTWLNVHHFFTFKNVKEKKNSLLKVTLECNVHIRDTVEYSR